MSLYGTRRGTIASLDLTRKTASVDEHGDALKTAATWYWYYQKNGQSSKCKYYTQTNDIRPQTMTSKIPPHVARELARHLVKKTPPPSSSSTMNGTAMRPSQSKVLFGTLTFLGVAFSIPFLATQWVGRLTDKEEALTAAQIRRGAFNNSGSRDVGRDPKWDFQKGMYKKDEDYHAIFARDNPHQVDHAEEFHQVGR